MKLLTCITFSDEAFLKSSSRLSLANKTDATYEVELNIDEYCILPSYISTTQTIFCGDVSIAQMAEVMACAVLGGVFKVVGGVRVER